MLARVWCRSLYVHVMYMSRVCDRDSARREAPRHKPPGSGVVHERSARAGIRPVARGSGDPLVCGRRAQQLTFIHSFIAWTLFRLRGASSTTGVLPVGSARRVPSARSSARREREGLVGPNDLGWSKSANAVSHGETPISVSVTREFYSWSLELRAHHKSFGVV